MNVNKPKLLFTAFLAVVLGIVLLALGSGRPADLREAAYVETVLLEGTSENLSVIVTAEDSRAAAAAVRRAGGTVSSDLWLIDAVAARIPAASLDRLAHLPGIFSIVNNKTVRTADWVIYNGSLATSLASPAGLDVGAGQLHVDPWGDPWISGIDVGIAVLDTGLYFTEDLNTGTHFAIEFLEQVDFAGDGSCRFKGGQQRAGFCRYRKFSDSFDPYGHGTHVSSIIGNRLYESNSGEALGVAPDAKIQSVRVLGDDGSGSYEDVVEGIQYVLEYGHLRGIRVINLSLSAVATTPYFIDPLNRAVEAAWAAGYVVVAAAGNSGPQAETITVPGNDPYIITVGSLDTNNTPADWTDDQLPVWSSTGPTLDNFIKPDVLAPGAGIVSLMYNDDSGMSALVAEHPDYASGNNLFRMSGTSMSTAVASGVVALMLQHSPDLTPDEVKFRLMYSARQLTTGEGQLGLSPLQQGAGRIWAPAAVLGTFPPDARANTGMDIQADLDHGWGYYDLNGDPVLDENELAHHYLGPVRRLSSSSGEYILFYADHGDGSGAVLGAAEAYTGAWLLAEDIPEGTTWSVGNMVWSGGNMVWSGGDLMWSTGPLFDSSGVMVWSGGILFWTAGGLFDADGIMVWSGGELFDANGIMVWSGGTKVWSGGIMVWSGSELNWTTGSLFDANGVMVWSGGNMVWSGSQLFDANGNLVWENSPLFDATGIMVWSGGSMVWSGSQMVWSGGVMVWSGGNMVWSGGNMVWSGNDVVWSEGHPVWSGGNMVWSGGNMVWSGGNMVWSGGNMVWSGGSMVWTDAQAVESGEVGATHWVHELTNAKTMFVSDLQGVPVQENPATWRATIGVTVHDSDGNPVEGVLVTGKGSLWNGRTTRGTCETDGSGFCILVSPRFPGKFTSAQFKIVDLKDRHWALVYDPAGNLDADGDSDGTLITVSKP